MKAKHSDTMQFMFQSPQWGSNSKDGVMKATEFLGLFQSPQWGSNSKDRTPKGASWMNGFQSPQWRNNSKVKPKNILDGFKLFQSPQWGNNSKAATKRNATPLSKCFSPLNGEIILKRQRSRTQRRYQNVSVPSMGK